MKPPEKLAEARSRPVMRLLLVTALLFSAVLAAAAEQLEKLSEEHRQWLERDVAYIITERERDVYLSLGSEEERDRFIEAFWIKRDPNRATPVNELKVEHYRRLDHADRFLGRDTFREGWRTDRGRYYIILGEPRETQRYDGYSQLVSVELWFYQAESGSGLPPFFYLLFFKRDDIGEFRLYHPVVDGPQALLRGSAGVGRSSPREAVEALRQVSPELAAASLSLDTSETPDFASGKASLGSAILIARIEETPKRKIRTDYADAWLQYGNRVSSDYSFNFIPSRNVFNVLLGKDNTALVQYSIEIDPENFTLESNEEQTKFYTTLDITLEVRRRDGPLIIADDKQAFVEISPAQMQQVRASPFAYQDDFPLVPGDYSVSVILRNRVVKQYTVAETELHVPDYETSGPAIVDIITAFDSQRRSDNTEARQIMTFQVGDLRLHPAADNLFVLGDTIHLFAQTVHTSAKQAVTFDLLDGERTLASVTTSVDPSGIALDQMRLAGIAGGEFELRAQLTEASGEVLSERRVSVTVSPRSAAPRPSFVYRRGFNAGSPGLLAFVRADQHWNAGDLPQAVENLNEALEENPQLAPARVKLANAYLRMARPDQAIEMLLLLEDDYGDEYEVVAGLGFANFLKDSYVKSVSYLSRARELRAPDVTLLNALGESYAALGNVASAREAFQSSLELDPDQEIVKQRIQSLVEPRH